MDPSQNGNLGGFNTNAGASFGIVNSAANMGGGDIMLTPSVLPKKRFSKTIAIIVGLVVLVVGAIATIAIINNQGSPEEEIYSALEDFYEEASYYELVSDYSGTIGMDFQDSDAYIDFFYSDGDFLESLNQELNSSRDFYDGLKVLNPGKLPDEQRKEFNLIVNNIDNVLDIMKKNIDVLTGFYDEFAIPLRSILSQKGESETCKKTNEIDLLIDNYIYGDLAEGYFSAYCEIVGFFNGGGSTDSLPERITSLAQEFIASLDEVIIDVDNYYDDEIETLLDYFEEPNENS